MTNSREREKGFLRRPLEKLEKICQPIVFIEKNFGTSSALLPHDSLYFTMKPNSLFGIIYWIIG